MEYIDIQSIDLTRYKDLLSDRDSSVFKYLINLNYNYKKNHYNFYFYRQFATTTPDNNNIIIFTDNNNIKFIIG